MEQIIFGGCYFEKFSHDNNVSLLHKEKSPNSPEDVLVVKNRDLEMQSDALSKMTFTKSSSNDMNEKEEL